MRAKDLKTDGTAYYYTTQNTWLRWSHQADKVVVLDATPGHWRWEAREDRWVRRPGGQQVLIEVCAKGGNAARRVAVTTINLRGEWDACVKQRAELHAEKSRADQERRERLRAIVDPCLDAAADLAGLGITADVDEDARHLYARITISHRALPALQSAIVHLIATGWTAPKD
jgi:hypothetical protein